ncbi:MAG: 16S rRNA processing protein RimM [Oscillospiraceae bacterium]|nr:16S rRNA processing protein RimM [Oscillospiraceae bacterium]
MELEFITAGQIVNTHGIRGEVKLLPQGVEPDLLAQCDPLYIGGRPFSPSARRIHKGCLLLRLEGVDDMDAALALKGKTVSIRRADAPLSAGEFFDEELVGLTARDAETGEELGKIDQVLTYPAHKIYAVRGGKDEYLVPAVPAFIAAVNLPGGTVEIHMIEGLGTHS